MLKEEDKKFLLKLSLSNRDFLAQVNNQLFTMAALYISIYL